MRRVFEDQAQHLVLIPHSRAPTSPARSVKPAVRSLWCDKETITGRHAERRHAKGIAGRTRTHGFIMIKDDKLLCEQYSNGSGATPSASRARGLNRSRRRWSDSRSKTGTR
jgi:hypothetical protein